MNKIHAKSPCCRTPFRRFGGRRRQCLVCFKTWRIRKKRRGRKRKRVDVKIAIDLLTNTETIRNKARRSRFSERSVRIGIRRSLAALNRQDWNTDVSGDKLVLIADGLWSNIGGRRWVTYLLAVRPLNSNKAMLLPPIFLFGTENKQKWNCVLNLIPTEIQLKIVALVADGIAGMSNLAKQKGWVFQQCQFHFIKVFQRFRGRKISTLRHKALREESYRLILKVMKLPYGAEYEQVIGRIEELAAREECPKWVKLHLRGFLRYREYFRAYIKFPQYNLPATTSAMESLCASIRDFLRRSRGFRTVELFQQWVSAFIKVRSKIKCSGRNQPN